MLELLATMVLASAAPAPQATNRWELVEQQPGEWAWIFDRASVSRRNGYAYAEIYSLSAAPMTGPDGGAYDYAKMGVEMDCERGMWSDTGGTLYKADGVETVRIPDQDEPAISVETTLLGDTLFKALCLAPEQHRPIETWSAQAEAFDAGFKRIR